VRDCEGNKQYFKAKSDCLINCEAIYTIVDRNRVKNSVGGNSLILSKGYTEKQMVKAKQALLSCSSSIVSLIAHIFYLPECKILHSILFLVILDIWRPKWGDRHNCFNYI
jgi:hypothetical protein